MEDGGWSTLRITRHCILVGMHLDAHYLADIAWQQGKHEVGYLAGRLSYLASPLDPISSTLSSRQNRLPIRGEVCPRARCLTVDPMDVYGCSHHKG